MGKNLRVISINFPFADVGVVQVALDSAWALFDFDVVVIRPQHFNYSTFTDLDACRYLTSVMTKKNGELQSFFSQGGVLVVFLDVPDRIRADTGSYSNPCIVVHFP